MAMQYWVCYVFSFWVSLITRNFICVIPFYYLFLGLMFFLCSMMDILKQTKKILVELINRLLYNTVHHLVHKYNRLYQTYFPFFFFFLEKIMFGLLASCLLLRFLSEYWVSFPGNTNSWMISICSTTSEKIYRRSSLAIQYQNVYLL